MILISIIIPVYKVEPYLRRCVDSLISQTYKNIEIILVDDGSPDNCGKICDEYADKDERVKVIHKKNGGLSDARNVALDIANGDYIGFVDSDDYVSSEMYERLVYEAVVHDCEMVVCGYYIITEEGDIIKEENCREFSLKAGKDMTRDLFLDKFPHSFAWNKIYKASLFKNVRYPVGRLYEDLALTYMLAYKCNSICVLNEPLYYYAISRKGNITTELISIKAAKSYYHHCLNGVEHINFAYRNKDFVDMIPFFKNRIYNNGLMAIKSSVKMGKESYDEYIIRITGLFKENGIALKTNDALMLYNSYFFYFFYKNVFFLRAYFKRVLRRK